MKKIFTKLFLFAALLVISADLSAQTYNGGTWYSLYDGKEHSNVVVYTDFAEKSLFTPVESITFDYKKFTAISFNGKVEVQNLVDGEWQKKGDASYSDYKNYKTSSTISLDANATKIRYYLASGSGVYVKNHFAKLAKHILLADGGFGKTTDSKSFDNTVVGQISAVQTVKLRSFLTDGDITITSDNPAFRIGSADNTETLVWTVGANACASTNGAAGTPAGGGALGDINLYDVNIYFCPTSFGPQSGIITISDGTSSATVSVAGNAVKEPQTITWEQELIDLKVDDVITLEATAATDITYESSDSNVAQVVGNQLYLLRPGTAVITANAIESNEYMSATLSREIVVDKADVLINVLPIASPITYGQSLAESLLSNGETSVEGVFEWLDPTIQPIPGEWIYVVTFTPVETDKYNSIDIEVSVLVNKVAQEILWDLTETSLEVGDTLYLDAIATSGLSIVYSVDNNEIARLEDNMLIALAEGAVSLTAAQDGDEENYVEAAEPIVYLITINAKLPTSLQTTQLGGAKAYKTIRNGQLVIISGEHTYDALGNLIR